ncbi:hypothetical protein [Aliamphritea spongicola]|nr:hypothetical protein [Aliamphritea spongicola]
MKNRSLYKVDDNDTTFAFGAGYQINKNFSAELGYTDLGKSQSKTITTEKAHLMPAVTYWA